MTIVVPPPPPSLSSSSSIDFYEKKKEGINEISIQSQHSKRESKIKTKSHPPADAKSPHSVEFPPAGALGSAAGGGAILFIDTPPGGGGRIPPAFFALDARDDDSLPSFF